MKKAILILTALGLLTAGAEAQIKRSSSTKLASTPAKSDSPDRNQMWYIGANVGTYVLGDLPQWSKEPHWPNYIPIFAEVGRIQAFGKKSLNDFFVPFWGADAAIGYGVDAGIYVHLSPLIGIMVGKPSFRLDLRLRPSITYVNDGWAYAVDVYEYVYTERYYEYYWGWQTRDIYDWRTHYERETMFTVLPYIDATIWFNHFGIGACLEPLYGGLFGHVRYNF